MCYNTKSGFRRLARLPGGCWLGFNRDNRVFYASDYFEQLYEWAVALIRKGQAFVCDLSVDEVREYRGAPTRPGKESPTRTRSVEENLDLFARMRAGEFPDASKTLRTKIGMTSPNPNLRTQSADRDQPIPHRPA